MCSEVECELNKIPINDDIDLNKRKKIFPEQNLVNFLAVVTR